MNEERLRCWRTQENAVVFLRLDMDPPEFRVGELLADHAALEAENRRLREAAVRERRGRDRERRHRKWALEQARGNMDMDREASKQVKDLLRAVDVDLLKRAEAAESALQQAQERIRELEMQLLTTGECSSGIVLHSMNGGGPEAQGGKEKRNV